MSCRHVCMDLERIVDNLERIRNKVQRRTPKSFSFFRTGVIGNRNLFMMIILIPIIDTVRSGDFKQRLYMLFQY
jgi:hypothetical protein